MEEDDSGSFVPHLVAEAPTITAKLSGVETECLLDIGFMVPLVSKSFYEEKLKPVCGGVKSGRRMLNLHGTNGLKIPYLGYLELDIEVGRLTILKCVVPVLKDTAAIIRQRRKQSGVLGINVQAKVPEWANLIQKQGSKSNSNHEEKPQKRRLVNTTGNGTTWIPPNSAVNIGVTGAICGANALVEPLNTPLKGGLLVTTTLVDACKTHFTIQVVNPTNRGINVKTRSCLGTIQPTEEVVTNDQLSLKGESLKGQSSHVRSEELMLSTFPGTEMERKGKNP